MKTPILITCLLWSVSITATTGEKTKNAEATILFRDGSSVHINYFGTIGKPRPLKVEGKHGGTNVSIDIAELSKMAFLDSSCRYIFYGNRFDFGPIAVVNRRGERFNLSEGRATTGSWEVSFVYNDPITKKLRESAVQPITIAEIVVGPTTGTLKANPITKEVFPDFYVYDPYTGHRLVWIDSINTLDDATVTPVQCRAIVLRKKPMEGKTLLSKANIRLQFRKRTGASLNLSTNAEGIASFEAQPGVYDAEVVSGSFSLNQTVFVRADGLLVFVLGD